MSPPACRIADVPVFDCPIWSRTSIGAFPQAAGKAKARALSAFVQVMK